MYLMYVDECGDKGMSSGSSRYFILSGLVVHESSWTDLAKCISHDLAEIYGKYGMDTRHELHAKDMLGRTGKDYSSVGKHDRVLMLRDVLYAEAQYAEYMRIINVVVDKGGKSFGLDAFTIAWDALINRFETTIRAGNFPAAASMQNEHGILIVDETDEKALMEHVRNMRWNNVVPSQLYPGSTYKNNLVSVIEDPMHKRSNTSIFIQLCDVNAYFLRQRIDPNSTIRKHKARFYFEILEPVLLKQASRKDPFGIVWR